MNRLILKFILLFKPVFSRLGVDTYQLGVILHTKLKMDDLRPSVYSRMGNKPEKAAKNTGWLAFVILAFTGLFLVFFLVIFKQPYLGHTVYFSAFMVMLAITLISDFTNVLIDVRDNYIILPRPVNDVTFTVSRILHIAIHSSKMAIGLAISGLVYIFIFEGLLAGAVFCLEVLTATILSIFLVNITYLVVLKLTSPERFKDFISYFQIIFSVVIFAAYYTLPRLVDSSMLEGFSIENIPAMALLPPVWIAALHELAVSDEITTKAIVLALIAVFSPLLSLYLIIKVLAPGFNKKLSSISGSGTDETAVQSQKKVSGKSFMSKVASLLAPHPVENAGFKITWLLSARYRDFKVKVYPAFAYVPVYFIYFGLINKKNQSLSERWESLVEGDMYILLAYLSGFVILTVLQHVSQTEKHKASWIYFSTPHNQPGRILGGMFKAIITKYYLPYFFILTVSGLIIWGPKVINDFLLALAVSLIYGLLTALFLVKGFPFSQPVNIKKGGKFFVSFFLMAIPAAIGFLHYWAANWEITIWVSAFTLLFLAVIIFSYYVKESWEKLEMAE